FLIFTLTVNSRVFAGQEPRPGQQTRSLTIQEAVKLTLEHAPEMRIAESQAERAGAAIRESRSLNRPQVVTGTGLAYNNGFPLSIEGAAPSIFQVGLSQSLLSKKNNNLIREAEEAGKTSRLGSESTKNDLAARTALVYYRLYRARQLAPIAVERLAGAEKYLEITESISESGRIRPVDISEAQAAVSSARQQLLIVREEADIAEMELRAYTGIPREVSFRVEKPELPGPSTDADAELLYQQTLQNSPEIQQAESDLRSKEFHLEAEKGERLPKINLVGQYALLSKANNYEDYFNKFSRNNYLIGFSVQIPVFDGFRAGARIAAGNQDILEARYRLEQIKTELKLAIKKGLSALRIAKGEQEHAQNEVNAARERLKVEEALRQNGRISLMEYEEARAGLFQKEFAQLEAEQALFERNLELLNLTGTMKTLFQ
ncbi:MAG: TolC family protein, partial [Acidobacteriota bacterium]